MFKISITETRSERRLIVEGKLVAPWAAELRTAWQNASANLGQRKLIIDLANVTVIGSEGQGEIVGLMKEGAKFSCYGVLTKYLLKRLSRSCHPKLCSESKPTESGD